MITLHSDRQLVSVEMAKRSSGTAVALTLEAVLQRFQYIENPDWSTLRVRIELDEVSKAFNNPDTLMISAYIQSRGDEEE